MNLKKKLFGTLAASAIALSMISGAAAETKETKATAVLMGGQCSVAVTGSLGFGGWTYDGTGYGITSGTDNDTLSWTLKAGNPAGCNVSLGFGGLYNGGHHIGLEHFYGELWGPSGSQGSAMLDNVAGLDSGTYGDTGMPSGSMNAYLRLASVPDDVMPGTYTGTIYTTVSNSQ